MYFLDLFLALLKDILFDLLAMGEATEKKTGPRKPADANHVVDLTNQNG